MAASSFACRGERMRPRAEGTVSKQASPRYAGRRPRFSQLWLISPSLESGRGGRQPGRPSLAVSPPPPSAAPTFPIN
ncbi:unnamed protein product [Coccothraustes coccothraustes]